MMPIFHRDSYQRRAALVVSLFLATAFSGCRNPPSAYGVLNESDQMLAKVVVENQKGERRSFGRLSKGKVAWHMSPNWETPTQIVLKGVIDSSGEQFEFTQDMSLLEYSKEYLFIISMEPDDESTLMFRIDASPKESS